MAFRFRKSIKIAPGVRMNIGKHGFSSLGVGNMNFGKRGVHQNFSIPGTGISYQAQIVGRSSTTSKTSKKSSKSRQPTMAVTLGLSEDGELILRDEKGQPVPENVARLAKRQNKEVLISWLEEQSEEFNQEIKDLIQIYTTTPAPYGEIVVNPKPPNPVVVKAGLASKFIGRLREKTAEKNKLAQEAYEESMRKWSIAENALKSDPKVMSDILENAFSTLEWPRETLVSYEIRNDDATVILDIDLPEIEDMPVQEASVNRNQMKLNIKKRPEKSVKLGYLTHIHAVGFRFVGDVFAYLPSINVTIISGYSQRINKRTGHLENEYLYSAKVDRKKWEQINFNNLAALDVVECFTEFDLRRKVTATGLISPIEPFG